MPLRSAPSGQKTPEIALKGAFSFETSWGSQDKNAPFDVSLLCPDSSKVRADAPAWLVLMSSERARPFLWGSVSWQIPRKEARKVPKRS